MLEQETEAFTSVAHCGKVWFLFYEHAVDIVVVVCCCFVSMPPFRHSRVYMRATVSYLRTK